MRVLAATTLRHGRGIQNHPIPSYLHVPTMAYKLAASRYSIITRKMIPLAYTEYLHMCAQSLAAAQDAPSDSDLIFHLEITREAEKVYTLFNYTETDQTQYMNDEQIQIYLTAFTSKLQDWRSRLPASLAEDREYGQRSCRIFCHPLHFH